MSVPGKFIAQTRLSGYRVSSWRDSAVLLYIQYNNTPALNVTSGATTSKKYDCYSNYHDFSTGFKQYRILTGKSFILARELVI
jgi:hypothetical protein